MHLTRNEKVACSNHVTSSKNRMIFMRFFLIYKLRRTMIGAAHLQLQQHDVLPCALLAHFLGPEADLDLADVGLAQQEHTKPGLTDAAAHA